MGFWIFMEFCNLLLPIIMIIFGRVFLKHPPRSINEMYGYRTSRSKKNQKTWDYAHEYCGRLWWKIGWIMFLPSILIMLPAIGKSDNMIGFVGAACMFIQCGILILSIFLVESALKKKFGI